MQQIEIERLRAADDDMLRVGLDELWQLVGFLGYSALDCCRNAARLCAPFVQRGDPHRIVGGLVHN
jgi:hypothetical protein